MKKAFLFLIVFLALVFLAVGGAFFQLFFQFGHSDEETNRMDNLIDSKLAERVSQNNQFPTTSQTTLQPAKKPATVAPVPKPSKPSQTTSAAPVIDKPAPPLAPLPENCGDKSQIPESLRHYRYFCADLATANAVTLEQQVKNSGAERLLLSGQNLFYDCPASLTGHNDVISRCLISAQFTDQATLPKMMAVYGITSLTKKAYYHFAKAYSEMAGLCDYKTASACLRDGYVIYISVLSSGRPFYNGGIAREASIWEGLNKEIGYEFEMITPANCYLADTHETIHFFNNQYFDGFVRSWFDESMTHFLGTRFFQYLCPPGTTLQKVVKVENGVRTPLASFDIYSLDDEEPLSSAVEAYSEGSECRRAIFMQLSQLLKQRGLSFVPLYYDEVKKMQTSTDTDFARALYSAAGSPEAMKTFFRQHQCL